ncbi:hypothetical protein [Pseudonocardia sp. TRM90224]|uniref:hypothetical protein n=1 Tax=Pseudonocardia sp. TRM90224 TaxID=2812678 RepID=UPI001E30DCC7|nr:hypothetical protein [Pseudonocardia sp. TRM90224]
MSITLPSFDALARFASANPVLTVVIAVLVSVVIPAVWSTRPERRCAASGVLGQLCGILGDTLIAIVLLRVVLLPQRAA